MLFLNDDLDIFHYHILIFQSYPKIFFNFLISYNFVTKLVYHSVSLFALQYLLYLWKKITNNN